MNRRRLSLSAPSASLFSCTSVCVCVCVCVCACVRAYKDRRHRHSLTQAHSVTTPAQHQHLRSAPALYMRRMHGRACSIAELVAAHHRWHAPVAGASHVLREHHTSFKSITRPSRASHVIQEHHTSFKSPQQIDGAHSVHAQPPPPPPPPPPPRPPRRRRRRW